MSTDEYKNKIKFKLSDTSGVLRFNSFNIIDVPQSQEISMNLRKYLLNRPLSEVDTGYINRLQCNSERTCMRAIAEIILEFKSMFLSGRINKNQDRRQNK